MRRLAGLETLCARPPQARWLRFPLLAMKFGSEKIEVSVPPVGAQPVACFNKRHRKGNRTPTSWRSDCDAPGDPKSLLRPRRRNI